MRLPGASSTMLCREWPPSTINTTTSMKCAWRSTGGPDTSRVFKIPEADRPAEDFACPAHGTSRGLGYRSIYKGTVAARCCKIVPP